MSTVRVNYTISEEGKEKTDFLKKKYKMNISELIDILIRFDEKSIEKMFEIYTLFHPDIIKKYNRIETPKGDFVFGEKVLDAVRNIPLSGLDGDKIDLYAVKALVLGNNTKEEELYKMLQNQNKITSLTVKLFQQYDKLAQRVEELENK